MNYATKPHKTMKQKEIILTKKIKRSKSNFRN